MISAISKLRNVIQIFAQSLLLLAGVSAFAAERAEVQFEKQIELSAKSEYRLSDLVEVKTNSASLLNELENEVVDLNTSKDHNLSANEIRQWFLKLQAKSEIYRSENPKLLIPMTVTIRFSKSASREHLARLIRNRLQTQCELCQVQVSSVSGMDRLRGLNWSLDLSNIKLGPSIMIPMQLQAAEFETASKAASPNSTGMNTQYLSAQLRISKMLWVTNKQIPYNTRIENQDLEQRIVDVSFAKETPVAKEQIAGSLTTRGLSAGVAIYPADLKREQAIKKAQLIRAIAGDSELEVTTSAMAEEGGFIGDMIKIKTLDGNKILSGVIVEKGSVRLQ